MSVWAKEGGGSWSHLVPQTQQGNSYQRCGWLWALPGHWQSGLSTPRVWREATRDGPEGQGCRGPRPHPHTRSDLQVGRHRHRAGRGPAPHQAPSDLEAWTGKKPLKDALKIGGALTLGEPEGSVMKGRTCCISWYETQHRMSSLKSAWIIDGDVLTNFRECSRGARICMIFQQEWKYNRASRILPFFSLAGLMLLGAGCEIHHLVC